MGHLRTGSRRRCRRSLLSRIRVGRQSKAIASPAIQDRSTTYVACHGRTSSGWSPRRFRRSGYRADLTARGADGGVDIILTRGGSKTLVQCKQNTSRLGPGVVRELAGVMASEDVTDGIVVACGGVGDEGQVFAKRNGIRILDGSALVGLLVEKEAWKELPRRTATTTAALSCPRCHSTMVRRSSRHGLFWGCSRFPNCRGTRALEGSRAQ